MYPDIYGIAACAQSIGDVVRLMFVAAPHGEGKASFAVNNLVTDHFGVSPFCCFVLGLPSLAPGGHAWRLYSCGTVAPPLTAWPLPLLQLQISTISCIGQHDIVNFGELHYIVLEKLARCTIS